MAGSWIKMRHDLIDAPEVRRIARATGLDRDQVYGKLFRLWSWADRHGHNGHLDAELEDVDDQVGHVGFGAALVSAGWLENAPPGIVIPNWDRHFSDSAKARALSQERSSRYRHAERVTQPATAVTLDAHQTRLDKTNPPPPPREDWTEEAGRIREAWAALAKAGHGKPYRSKLMPEAMPERLAEPGWAEDALAAIQALPRCRYFDSPATLIQLCLPGFVGRVLGGQYDEPKASKAPPRPDGPAPPRVDPAFAAAREATERRERQRMAEEHRKLDEAATTARGSGGARLKLVAKGSV